MSSASKFRKKAVEYEQLKQFDRAVASYVRAIEESENAKEEIDVALFNKVGDLTLRQGRVTEAVTYYERAVEHYVSNSLFDNAIALCNKILRNTPGRSNVYFTLGRICGRKGLRSDATRNFLEYATRMQQENRVEEGMRALAEVADLMPELTEVNRLVEEYAARAGINLSRKRATPTRSNAQAEPEPSRLFGMSRDLVFLDVDYEEQARAKTPLAARAVANAPAMPLASVSAAPVAAAPAARVAANATAKPGVITSQVAAPATSPSTSTPRSSRLEDLMIFDPNESTTAHKDVLGDRSESVVDSAPILTPYVDLSTPVEALTDLALPSFERDVPESVELPVIETVAVDANAVDLSLAESTIVEAPFVGASNGETSGNVAAVDEVVDLMAVIVEPTMAALPTVASANEVVDQVEIVAGQVTEAISLESSSPDSETAVTVSLDVQPVELIANSEVEVSDTVDVVDADDASIFGNVQVASYTHETIAATAIVDDVSIEPIAESSAEASTALDELIAESTLGDDVAVDESSTFSEPSFELNAALDASYVQKIPELLQPVVPEFSLPEFEQSTAELSADEFASSEFAAGELSPLDVPAIDLPTIELSDMHSVDSEFLVIDEAVLDVPELDALAPGLSTFDASVLELPTLDESLLDTSLLDTSLLDTSLLDASLVGLPTIDPASSNVAEVEAIETLDENDASAGTVAATNVVAADATEFNSDKSDDSSLVDLIDGIIDFEPDVAHATVADDSDNQDQFEIADAVASSITVEQQLEATEPIEALAGLTSEEAEVAIDDDSLLISADDNFNVVVSNLPGASLPSLDFDAMLDVETEQEHGHSDVEIAPIAELEIEEFTPLSIDASNGTSIDASAEDRATADALLLAIELDDETEISPAAPFEFNSAQTVADFDEELTVELPDEFDASVELPPLVVESSGVLAGDDELDGIEFDDAEFVEVPEIDAAQGLVRVVPPEEASVQPLSVTSDHEIIAELAEARPLTVLNNPGINDAGDARDFDAIDFDADDAEDILDEFFIATDVPTAVAAAEATLVATSRLAEMQDASERDPDNSLLRRRFAEALFESGNRDAAIRELGAALAIVELSGNLSDALDIANQLVRVDVDQVTHHQKRLELSIRLGDQSRLRDAYLDFADALVRQGEELRARAVFARVLEIDPWDDRARAALGDAAPPPPPKPPVAGSDSDHVNLADWLRDDDEPASTRLRMREPDVTGDEQDDFNALLKHFKEGVARSLGEDDYESHYDLGVAYKEMGLLDDAIAEFQMALRSRTNRLPAYEALGQCFLEQQSYKVAVTVLSRALHEPDVQDEQRVGVLYLLGYSCEVLQRFDEARGYFQRVYATDIHFRDVAKRLAALDRTMR